MEYFEDDTVKIKIKFKAQLHQIKLNSLFIQTLFKISQKICEPFNYICYSQKYFFKVVIEFNY